MADLTPDRRTELNGIVTRMMADGHSEDDIGSVIRRYGERFGSQATAPTTTGLLDAVHVPNPLAGVNKDALMGAPMAGAPQPSGSIFSTPHAADPLRSIREATGQVSPPADALGQAMKGPQPVPPQLPYSFWRDSATSRALRALPKSAYDMYAKGFGPGGGYQPPKVDAQGNPVEEPGLKATASAIADNPVGVAKESFAQDPLGTMATAGGAVKAAMELPNAVRSIGKAISIRPSPKVAMNKAFRPIPSEASYPENIENTISAIKAVNPDYMPTVAGGDFRPNIDAADKTAGVYRAALKPYQDRVVGQTVHGQSIVDATKRAMAGMLESEQDPSWILKAEMDYGKDFSEPELAHKQELLNKKLDPFYAKSHAKQLAALGDIPDAVTKAQRDAVASLRYNMLDPENGGAGPRRIQSALSDTIRYKNNMMRRQNAIIAEQPLTPLGETIEQTPGVQAGKTVFKKLWPGAGSSTGISYAEGSQGQSLKNWKKAFDAVLPSDMNLPTPDTPGPYTPAYAAARNIGSPYGPKPLTQLEESSLPFSAQGTAHNADVIGDMARQAQGIPPKQGGPTQQFELVRGPNGVFEVRGVQTPAAPSIPKQLPGTAEVPGGGTRPVSFRGDYTPPPGSAGVGSGQPGQPPLNIARTGGEYRGGASQWRPGLGIPQSLSPYLPASLEKLRFKWPSPIVGPGSTAEQFAGQGGPPLPEVAHSTVQDWLQGRANQLQLPEPSTTLDPSSKEAHLAAALGASEANKMVTPVDLGVRNAQNQPRIAGGKWGKNPLPASQSAATFEAARKAGNPYMVRERQMGAAADAMAEARAKWAPGYNGLSESGQAVLDQFLKEKIQKTLDKQWYPGDEARYQLKLKELKARDRIQGPSPLPGMPPVNFLPKQ